MILPRFRFYGRLLVYREAVASLLARRTYRGGEVAQLERVVSELVGVDHVVAAPQGRVALYLLLKHTIRRGQSVLMSPYTIFDVVNMVICAGGVPKFVDIRYSTCNLDPQALRKAVAETNDIGAVIVTHLHGFASDLTEIAEICEERGLALIEDAAQAFGTVLNGRTIGSIGRSAILSLGRTKNINCLYGGMVLTHDNAVAQRIRDEISEWPGESELRLIKRLATCAVMDLITWPPIFSFSTFWLFRFACLHDVASVNKLVQTENAPYRRAELPDHFRRQLTPMQARIALSQLDSLNKHAAHRSGLATIYRNGLRDLPQLTLLPCDGSTSSNHLTFPILTEARNDLVKHLMRSGCDVMVQHLHNTADLTCYREYYSECMNARKASISVILLPTYPGYTADAARAVVKAIRAYFEQ